MCYKNVAHALKDNNTILHFVFQLRRSDILVERP